MKKIPTNPLEAKAKQWALYGLALALLTCLTAWGAREVKQRHEVAKLEASEQRLSRDLSAALAERQELRLTLSRAQAELQQSSSTKHRRQGGSTIVRPDGTREETWVDESGETLETLSQTLQELSTTKEQLISKEQALAEAQTTISRLEQQLHVATSKVVASRAHGPVVMAGYDLAGSDWLDRLDLGLGWRFGTLSAGVTIKPGTVKIQGNEGWDWTTMHPTLRASLALP